MEKGQNFSVWFFEVETCHNLFTNWGLKERRKKKTKTKLQSKNQNKSEYQLTQHSNSKTTTHLELKIQNYALPTFFTGQMKYLLPSFGPILSIEILQMPAPQEHMGIGT